MAPLTTLFPLPPVTGQKQSKRKSPALQRIKVDHKLAKARYYNHRRLKGVFPVDGDKRIIDVAPYEALEDIPAKHLCYVRKLIDLGYNAQLKIPCPKVLPSTKVRKPRQKKIPSIPTG